MTTNAPNALWILAKGTKARVFTLPNSIRYDYTGAIQTFTVPDDIASITIEAHGAQGGQKGSSWPGGLGAKVIAVFDVIAGAVYDVYVGGYPGTAAAGGWPNGGLGDTNVGNGCGGGGRSEVRPTGGLIAATLLIAGGGGGAGDGGSPGNPDVHGGAAGFYVGLDGGDGSFPGQVAGGDGANLEGAGLLASPGGNGFGGPALHTTNAFAFCGGGGGDGWYGGGGATGQPTPGVYCGGGGGAVSYVAGAGSDLEYTDAENVGHGFVIVSWATPL